ncbi:Zn-dependent hydrolase [Halobacteriales archaeon QS_3_64_16]|nr:MAG: Zn-dependent hydrolase [Halobacteriales archaeon QS_3_64_16]
MNLPISEERLRADIEATAEFGAIDAPEGRGRTVLTGTDANRAARDYLTERLGDAGLEVRVDAVGNIAGRWTPTSADPGAPAVASGSHLDSVIEGGIFDGPLGTYAALEAVRAMQEGGTSPDRPIEVVCFTEEEGGRFGEGLTGSAVAAGAESIEETLALTDSEETTLEAALEGIGYRGEGHLAASDWDSWLEVHIEQGTRLESAGEQAGIVTTITGITHCDATITGETDHAGSTPMSTRTDALAAAKEVIGATERAGRQAAGLDPEIGADGGEDGPNGDGGRDTDETAVATVGKIDARPNATNVVPGAVDLGIDIRDVEYETMNRIVEEIEATLERIETDRGVETSFERPFDVTPTPMAQRCRDASRRAAEDAGIAASAMHSDAAHDTMYVARRTNAGMVFAPSRGGYSHSPREWTDWADCAATTRVLAGALADLADV